MNKEIDNYWMSIALSFARRSLGRTNENPPVGCVIVSKDNNLVSFGSTQKGGRPHAEIDAIDKANSNIEGSTIYVTLEPCFHYGKTDPCINKIIKSGIRRLVYSIDDPDPRVNGKSFEFAKKSGLVVKRNIQQKEALSLYKGFFSRIQKKKPFVTSKIATCLNGFITSTKREKIWISNEFSKIFVHDLRSRSDAILTGIGTVLVDDPELNCRKPTFIQDSPIRVILDSSLKINIESNIIKTSNEISTIIYCKKGVNSDKKKFFINKGIEVIEMPYEKKLCERSILNDLSNKGVNNLLIEAGEILNSNFRFLNLIDKIIWIKSVKKIKDGLLPFKSEFFPHNNNNFNLEYDFKLNSEKYICDDHISIWEKK